MTICKLYNLITLDLSNNDLTDLPSEIGFLQKLVRIHIEGNPLKTIKQSIKAAGAVKLKDYLLTRISGNLEEKKMELNPNYSKLKPVDFWEQLIRDFLFNNELQVREKKIKELDERIFKIENLKLLDFSKNELTFVSDSIENLQKLKVLRLNENKIEILPDNLIFLINIQEFEFRKNKISSFFDNIPPELICKNWFNITILDLSSNRLRKIPKPVFHLKKLKTLNLSFNSIIDIGNIFNKDSPLDVLDLGNNQINFIDDNVDLIPKLGFLNLENNNLTKIPTKFGFFSNLKSLKLQGNPLKLINRSVLEKGTNTILEYLKNKHTGPIPYVKSDQKIEEDEREEERKMEIETENMNKKRLSKEERILCEREISNLDKSILENDRNLRENFSLNNFQKNDLKKKIQNMKRKKSELILELKN